MSEGVHPGRRVLSSYTRKRIRMVTRIYKETHFDASHRLMHYVGKCSRLHGHRWSVEVWIDGTPDEKTQILIDYNIIKNIINVYDHQVILNKEDPMAEVLSRFQTPVLTNGDPTSELLAVDIRDRLNTFCRENKMNARVAKIRVWESDGCYAEVLAE
jgi:6-pyruvoyltetrahydropterin/6-carboxytetrahydropterin synthase